MQVLKVVTLNIWNRQGPWPRRLELIRDGLAGLAPDLVGLQEVLRHDGEPQHQADEVAAACGYPHVAYAPAWNIGGPLHLGNALLSRHPITASEGLALPPAPGKEHHGVLCARVDAPCGEVPVFVTHLAWRLHHGHVRVEQVKRLAAIVKERAPIDGFPPVLMGDFNAPPDADEIRYLRGLTALGGASVYFADCWEAGDGGPGHTWSRANRYALSLHEPSRRIDYVFVRGPDRRLRGEPLAARVVLDQPVDGVFPSDHFGVYAEIQAAPRPLESF